MINLSLFKPNKKLQERIEFKSEFGFDTRAARSRSVAKRMSEPFKSCSLLKKTIILYKNTKPKGV
ncbi:MAG: hypothetical protein OXM55_03885 [Bdellovibrionales bacterium]|nr:hypothetical protein [Bdellovibrionales bacterium]